MDEFTISLIIIVICVLLIIFVIKRRAKKEGVTFTQALLRTLMETPQERKAKKRRKDSRMTPQQDAMSDYPWKRDPWKQAEKQKEKQKAQSGKEAGYALIAIALIGCMAYYVSSSSSYGGSGSYTNGTNNGSSNVQYANGVTVNNVKEYFGYGSETVVVDCSEVRSHYDINEKVKEALIRCPDRILVWGVAFFGRYPEYPFLYECFWTRRFNHTYYTVNDTYVTVMEPTYTVTDPDEIARMQREIDEAAQEIIAKCPWENDEFECCKVIHDELIKRVTYDKDKSNPHAYDAYGALVDGEAVCLGYACAFSYLTNLMEYESEIVVSETHAWNMLQLPIDCNDSFIDVTWDDKDYQDDNGNDVIVYDYFGLTREEVEAIDSHAIAGINGTEWVVDDYPYYSYHKKFGYVCSSYDYSYDRVVEIFSMQDARNGNTASIKFLDDESWNWAKSELLSNDKRLLWDAFFEAIGYRTKSRCWVNDDLRVISIGIE